MPETIHLGRDDAAYPAALRGEPFATLTARGNLGLLPRAALALFCSVKCPGALILPTLDLMQHLRAAAVAVVGGFHSPMERECLKILLRGQQPVIICPARSIEGMRLPVEYRRPLLQGRLLLLTPFVAPKRRSTAEDALTRNRFVAALSASLFVAHAEAGGKVEALCREAIGQGKVVHTWDSPANASVIALGARPVGLEQVGAWVPGELARALAATSGRGVSG